MCLKINRQTNKHINEIRRLLAVLLAKGQNLPNEKHWCIKDKETDCLANYVDFYGSLFVYILGDLQPIKRTHLIFVSQIDVSVARWCNILVTLRTPRTIAFGDISIASSELLEKCNGRIFLVVVSSRKLLSSIHSNKCSRFSIVFFSWKHSVLFSLLNY